IDSSQSIILDVFVKNQEQITITGRINSEPIVNESYSEFTVETDSLIVNEEYIPLATKVLVKTDTYTSYEFDDQVMVKAMVEKPEAFVTDTNRIFDYAAYLGKDGVYYIMSYA